MPTAPKEYIVVYEVTKIGFDYADFYRALESIEGKQAVQLLLGTWMVRTPWSVEQIHAHISRDGAHIIVFERTGKAYGYFGAAKDVLVGWGWIWD